MESEEMMANLIALADKMKPDLIVCLGDILDRHETIHVTPLTSATQFLYQLEQIAPLYVIIGNHDRPNNSDFLSGQHPFNALKMWKNTVVVDTVVKATFKGFYEFIFVPYVYPGRFAEAIATLECCDRKPVSCVNIETPKVHLEIDETVPTEENMFRKSSINAHAIFAHQEFYGAKMGAIISQQGDKWPHHYPLIISGHIHDYGRPQHNIIYTGTPMQHAFGDQDTKSISQFVFTPKVTGNTIHMTEHHIDANDHSKIIVCIDAADNSHSEPDLNGVSINGNGENIGWTEHRHDLGLTKRVICYVNAMDIMDWKPPENKLVKMVIRGNPEEIKTASKYGYLDELKKQGVKVAFKTSAPTNIDVTSGYNGIEDSTFTNVPYLVRLQQTISNDPGQQECFEKVFGGHADTANTADSVVVITSSTPNSTPTPTPNVSSNPSSDSTSNIIIS